MNNDTPTPISPTPSFTHPRKIERIIAGQGTQDGAGVKLTRLLGGPALQRRLDPYLMLDAFGTDQAHDYIAGFPDHPHRGFETITYMIAGRMRHRDSAGNEGLLEGGGVQWMTAGRGVIHSEMPEQESGRMEGFQIWLNLPAHDKMRAPWYRDISAQELPHLSPQSGVDITLIAGELLGTQGAVVREQTQPLIADIALEPGVEFKFPLPASMHAALVTFRGDVTVQGESAQKHHLVVLAQSQDADHLTLRNTGSTTSRCLLLGGLPLNQPIAQYGPFVMNTQEEIFQAVHDFQRGTFAASLE